jgi:hypothetical protein
MYSCGLIFFFWFFHGNYKSLKIDLPQAHIPIFDLLSFKLFFLKEFDLNCVGIFSSYVTTFSSFLRLFFLPFPSKEVYTASPLYFVFNPRLLIHSSLSSVMTDFYACISSTTLLQRSRVTATKHCTPTFFSTMLY